MRTIDKLKDMDKYEFAEWLFIFGLNCDGMSKGDIVRMLDEDAVTQNTSPFVGGVS